MGKFKTYNSMKEKQTVICCNRCFSPNKKRNGIDVKSHGVVQRWRCLDCDKGYDDDTGVYKEIEKGKIKQDASLDHIKKIPNVLLLDIETLPMEVFVWGLYKQRISPDKVIKDWCMLSYAAKWLFHQEMTYDILTSEEALKRDDSRICNSLWKLMEEADVVIAHNGIRFDIRAINARFILNGLKKPSPYQVIDTLIQSRKTFMFSSHKLNYLGQILIRKEKLDTDFDLWRDCVQGKQEALDYMLKYNIEDVNLLEEVYVQIRGWITSHPNMIIYAEATESCCPVCTSKDIEEKGEYVTTVNAYTSLRCNNCGAIMRKRKSNIPKEQKQNLYISNAR